MRSRSKITLACVLSLTASFTVAQLTQAQDMLEAMYQQRGDTYVPISVEEVKSQALTELTNARSAGRISAEEGEKFAQELNNATSLDTVEETWAALESKAQVAKEKHAYIDNLINDFNAYLNKLERNKIVSREAMVPYRDRARAIERLRKQFFDNDKFYDFWEYNVLALDLSSLEERLARALSADNPYQEALNDLILRTDNYLLRNEVAARGLTVYKSYEVEPDGLLASRNEFYAILKNIAHSNLKTQKVHEMVYRRLRALHTEPFRGFPSEIDIDKAMVEVQRLLDSGSKNGHLSATDDVRLQHELELVKQIKKAYPGDKPGLDPVERELRNEEVRYMCQDLRFLQNWLGRVLRKDGDNDLAREQVTRLVHRIELTYYTRRITKADVNTLLGALDDALKSTEKDSELIAKCKAIQGRMDMMVSDYSMVPAQVEPRLKEVSRLITMLGSQSGPAGEKDRIARLASKVESSTGADKYGASIVAAAETEILRAKVNAMLRRQGTTL